AVNLIGGFFASMQTGDVLGPRLVDRMAKAWALASDPKAKAKDVLDVTTIAARDWEREQRAFLVSVGVMDAGVTLREIQETSSAALIGLLQGDTKTVGDRALGAAHGAAIGNALGRVAGGFGQGIGIAAGATAGAIVGGKSIVKAHETIAKLILSKP